MTPPIVFLCITEVISAAAGLHARGTEPAAAARDGASAAAITRSSFLTPFPRAVVPLRGKVYCQGSRFPETATTLLGVLQPWPLPSQGPFPKKSGRHDHNPISLRTTCRTDAASPRTVRTNAGTQIDQAAGHAVIWGRALGVRGDAQGTRDGRLSRPRRRWPVCAGDHILKNERTATENRHARNTRCYPSRLRRRARPSTGVWL
jgi:hypothetical protein